MKTTIKLSPEQQQVVDYRGGDLQVIACAGSGKTESISRRVAALITEGAAPESIVAFTFTERAAVELKDRIARRVAERMGKDFLDRLGPMFVGTIHGYCFHMLQDHVPRYGNYDVLDEHRHAGLLSREYRNLGISKLGNKHWQPIGDFLKHVDVIGNELIDPVTLAGTPLGEVYAGYREMLDRYHFLTFSLIISNAIEALENTDIFARVHGPLRYLVVDEYQDINPAQERLIELLSTKPVELCVVGDDDQAIYQWRGSDVRNIVEFSKRRSAVKTLVLNSNRRSTAGIVTKANTFAKTIPGRLSKAMNPKRKPREQEIIAWSAETEEDEAERIAGTIKRLHKKGFRYRDIAVLYRSVRTSAPPLIEALRKEGIPFSCGGRTGLFLQPEIAVFGELFAWLADGNWKDDRYGQQRLADLDNIVSGLQTCFADGDAIPGLRNYLKDWKTYQQRGTRTMSLVGDFYQLLWKLKAHEIDIDTPEGSARFGAFARFSQVLGDFEHVNRRGRYVEEGGQREFRGGQDRGKYYLRNLNNYLLHYARDAYEEFEGEPEADLDAVDILTIHQAKGLEWPVVFMPALVSKRFPSSMTGRGQNWLLPDKVFTMTARHRYEGSETDERRLFYVAMTRARDCLYLSHFERKKNSFSPSPYLLDVAGKHIPALSRLPLPEPPEKDTQAEPPALELSFSELASFEECGFRYRLGSALGFQVELALELGYGNAIHHVLRHVAETAQATGKVPDTATLEALINEEFYLPFANKPAFERMYQAARRLVSRYVGEYSSDLGRVWATERPFELHLEDGVVMGRADIILDRENGNDGSLAIVDYKLANDPVRDDRYRLQLAVYTAAARGEGLIVDGAYLHELGDGSRNSVDITRKTVDQAVVSVGRSLAGIRQGNYPARPEQSKCQRCDFRQICRHTAGSAAVI